MSKANETPVKKTTPENKVVEAKTETSAKADNKSDTPAKTEKSKIETSTKTENQPDTKPKKQDMGEGQKAVSKAYKDNWNDIFAKKKKR